MIEQEWKALLTPAVFDRVLAACPFDDGTLQTNYYFADAAGLLATAGITVRVRQRCGQYALQLKLPHAAAQPGLHIQREYEQPLPALPHALSAGLLGPLTGLALQGDAVCIGSLTTLRRTWAYDPSHIVCLDDNRYLNQRDYELELEYTTPQADPALLARLAALGVDFSRGTPGKRARFNAASRPVE